MNKFILVLLVFMSALSPAQQKKKKTPPPFKWVNELPADKTYPGLSHKTFKSSSMGIDVGYCIYLPPQYGKDSAKNFPVVYYLHGGRPGSEIKSIRMVEFIHKAVTSDQIKPMLYVFANGGPVSHYNYPEKERGTVSRTKLHDCFKFFK